MLFEPIRRIRCLPGEGGNPWRLQKFPNLPLNESLNPAEYLGERPEMSFSLARRGEHK